MAHFNKESLQIGVIDVLVEPIINCVEGTPDSKVVALLKVSLELLCSVVKHDLEHEQFGKSLLYQGR